MHNSNIGSKSLRGQDRGVDYFAVTTNKSIPGGWIYSLNFGYKMKPKINKLIAAQGWDLTQPLQIEIFDDSAEYRLTSLQGQDRSVNHKNYAREIDNAHFTFYNESEIYSPKICYTKNILTL